MAFAHAGTFFERAAAMRIISTVLVLALLPACYFGRSPGAKRTAYGTNGVVIATGSLIMLSAANDPPECMNCESAALFRVDRGGVLTLGAIIVAAGLLGVALNKIVPTEVPEVDARPPQPITGQVKVFGLEPAVVGASRGDRAAGR